MKDLARRTLIGVLWNYLTFLGTKGINLVSLIILARLLGPGEFGLMAICVVVIAYFEIVARFGLGAALVSEQDAQQEMETAVAAMSLVAAGAMVALAWALAPLVAAGFDETGLTWPLRVIALALLIDAFAVVPSQLMSKRLQFQRKAVPDTLRSLVKAAASILLAMLGFGVWALVWGHVLGTAAAAAASILMVRWRPRAGLVPAVAWRAFRFGGHLLLAEAINAAQRNLDALLVGKLMGADALGIYSLAFRMPDLVIRSFNQVTGAVLHPAISAGGVARESLAAAYLASLRHVALVTFPAGAALWASAGAVVGLLYTEEWAAMAAPMAWLSIALALLTVDFVPGIIYKAMGRTDLLLWTSLFKLPVFAGVLVLAAPHGLTAIALAQIGLSLFYALPNWLILRRILGLDLRQNLRALLPAALIAAAVAALCTGLGLVPLGHPGLVLLLQGLGFAAVFLPGLLIAAPDLRAALARRLERRRAR